MPLYEVGTARFYPELGRWAYPGEPPIELPEDVADRYMHNEQGLLKPVRRTTQATPAVTRKEEKPAKTKRRTRK